MPTEIFLSRAKNISARAIFFIENFIAIAWSTLDTKFSLASHYLHIQSVHTTKIIKCNNKEPEKYLLLFPHLIWNKMVLRVPSGHWKSLDILGFACCSPLGNVLLFFCSNGCLCKVRKSYTTAATLESLIHVSQYFLA